MPTFDWQLEWEVGDEPWESNPSTEARLEPGKAHRPILVATIVALLLSGIVIYWQVASWSERAVANVKESLLSTISLMHYAASRADEELLMPLVSAHPADWAAEQQLLVIRGLSYDRSPLGLHLLPSIEPTIMDVSLSPDLTTAVVLYEQSFQLAGDGPSAITLRQAEFYRSHGQGWLRAAPEEDFWDGWIVVHGELLTMGFPGRDADLGRRLAGDLDRQLVTMCRALEALDCPDDLRVRVRLEKSLAILADMADRNVTMEGTLGIELPSPTLIGVPVDERGYQAIYRGYALHVIPTVIGELVGWKCCRQQMFHLALVDKQLARLGLKPWSLDYEIMSGRYFDLGKLNALWRTPNSTTLSEEERWQVYAFVDFLTETADDAPIAELQRQLSAVASFRSWVRPYFEETLPTEFGQKKAWLQFAYDQTTSAKTPAPIPLPADVELFCVSGPHRALYQYDLQANSWSKIRSLDDDVITVLSPLPDDGGVILLQQPLSGTGSRAWTILRQNGEESVIPIEALGSAFYPVYKGANLPGQNLLVISAAPNESVRSIFNLVELDSCAAAGCDLLPLPGSPVWSPDGQHMLIGAPGGQQGAFSIMLADAQGQAPALIGSGTAPFWLDEQTYGYISSSSERAWVVLAELDDRAPTILLAAEDLQRRLPASDQPAELAIRQVFGSPTDSNLLFIDALSPSNGTQYMFSFERRSRKIDLRFQFDDHEALIDFRFSPDGRYWTMSTHTRTNAVGSTWALHLHDIEKNETTFFSFYPIPYATYSYDWSADGRWLVKVENGLLNLFAPDYDYQEMVFFDQSLCTSAVWVHNTGDI